jgi:hypothetical protein
MAVVPAVARASGADVTSVAQHNVTRQISFTNPCGPESGQAVLTETEILTITHRANDTFSVVSNSIGSFTFTTGTGSVIAGHFENVFLLAGGYNDVQMSLIVASGLASDGSRFTLTFIQHLTEAPSGFTLSFDRCA